jgi:hypothetical protein
MTSPRRDSSIANIAVPSFAGRLDKTSEVIDAPHQTITQKSATNKKIDDRGKQHASTRVQGPGALEVTTNMRRLASGRRLQTNNRISRRMNWGGAAIERRPGALSVKGRAPGRAPEWIQRRIVNDNNRDRSSTQGKRTSAIQCEAFAIRQSLVVPGNFHVVRSSEITVKRASRVPTDDQSHLPPEMRTVISSDQELRLIEEHESNIPDDEDSGSMRKFRANIVPNRRISKLPTAEVALVNGELVHQLVRESQVISVRDSSNIEADDLSKSRRKCMVSLFRLLGFKRKKKKHQPDADVTIE